MVKCKDVVGVSVALIFGVLNSLHCIEGSQDICGGYNGRRLYLELGARGVISAQNITLPNRKTIISNSPQSSYYNGSSHEQCTLELVTCPGCVLSVVFHHLNLSHQCSGVNSVIDSPCHCDYVWLSEPPYEDVSGVPFCGIHNSLPSDGPGSLTYRSLTRTLSIVFLYSEVHTNAFSFEFSTERNRQFLKGYPRDSGIPPLTGNISHGGIIKSPFFPALYPRDLGIEYIIACQPDLTVSCRVRILFHDFQIDVASIMEFYDWNGQRLEISTGSAFRPPVILSTGPSLMVRFYANGGTNLGYKATYSFLSGNLLEKNIKPDTDCGGYVENLGGAITMMNMVTEGVKTYDCVWLIRPPKNYIHLKTHLYLKVATFSDMAGNTELQVIRGLTSEQPLLEMMRHPINQLLPHRYKEHIVPVDVGFYVSLRGSFGSASRLAIVYTSFSYSDCFTGADTLCQNHRCIPSQLFCDGFDHCGDNSDEPATCYQDWKADPHDRHWYSHTPNYYFPKMERYPDLKTATLIFIMSCLGLILLIAALILLLYRMGSRVRHQREIQNHLQTISDLLAANVILDGGSTEEVSPDDPPVYEAPPDYEDVIKVFIDASNAERRKLRDISGNDCTPSCNRQGLSETFSRLDGFSSLDISTIPTPEPMTIGRCLTESAPGLLTVTCATRPNSCTPANTSRSCQTTPIPDSPPPPYSHVEGVPGINSRVYDPAASYVLSSPPLCYSSLPESRNTHRMNGKGRKFREAWLVSRDELVRSLQEVLSSNSNVNDDNEPSTTSSRGNTSIEHGQNTDVRLAYQLQNRANEVIDQQNINSISEHCRQLMNPGSPVLVGNIADRDETSSNDNQSSLTSQFFPETEAAFQCSCEGACGCATANSNAQIISNSEMSQEELSRSCTLFNDTHLLSDGSSSSGRSSVSNLVWISAESQDFL